MSVGGVEIPTVYLPAQALAPLSASKEPIAMALAARPDLSQPSATSVSKDADKGVQAITSAHKTGVSTHEKQRSSMVAPAVTEGVAAAGRVDVYV